MKNAYLLSLEQQIAEKQQRKLREEEQERERDRAVRASAPAALGLLGSPSRGGGGEPLRDADGRVLSGVRGLFHRELLGAPPPTAQRHGAGAGAGGDGPPGTSRLATSATGRRGLRDPNAGHHIFGAPAETALCGVYGDMLPRPARGGAAPLDMSALPRPRTESLLPAPDSHRAPALPWPEPAAQRRQRPDNGSVSWRLKVDEGSAETLDSFHPSSIPSPRFPACASRPWGRDHTPPPLVDEENEEKRGGGAAAGGFAACREWVEALVLDRERLRQQLRDAGLDPCC